MASKKKVYTEDDLTALSVEATEVEMARAEAESRSYDADTNVSNVERMQAELELERERYKDILDDSVDFRHGYIVYDDDITPSTTAMVGAMLRRFSRIYPGQPITMELNTRGGDIVAGLGLFDEMLRLRREGHVITVRVRGQAASMGIVLLQAADIRQMGPSSFIMFHRAAFGAVGKTFEVEDELETAKMFERRIVTALAERSGNPESYFTDLFKQRKDIWYAPQQALEVGLIDGIG